MADTLTRDYGRVARDGSYSPTGSTYSSTYTESESQLPGVPIAKPRSESETVRLFYKAVENARKDTQKKLAGTEGLSEAVRPKLTVDVGYSRVGVIPEDVVGLIKDEVERLSLSHNQIPTLPSTFSLCTQLRYLNIRSNCIADFPVAILKMSVLEILDMSKNKIHKIPEDIETLASLRVFSVQYNLLEDLPLCLGDMPNLQIIKPKGNPLRPALQRIVDSITNEIDPSIADNMRDQAITGEIKQFMRHRHYAVKSDVESGGESSEGALDAPRILRRGLSLRFPVVPSGGSDATIKPPIPSKSHHRLASGQQGITISGPTRRSSLAPLSNGNERIRSNSESVLQASQAARTRRLASGMRKPLELRTVPEARMNRYSHFRGLSHNSALRDKSPVLSDPPVGSISPASSEKSSLPGVFMPQLKSLPAQKPRSDPSRDLLYEGIRGVLYALFEIHPHICSCINVVQEGTSKRNSLELVFDNANSGIQQLDDELVKYHQILNDGQTVYISRKGIRRACISTIKAYSYVCLQIKHSVAKIVADGDKRYVRGLLRSIYGSLVEIRNACQNLEKGLAAKKFSLRETINTPTIHESPTDDQPYVGITTPIQEPRRLRANTAIHRSPIFAYQPPVPLYVGSRSRSNSRNNMSSATSSVATTPRTTEAFSALQTLHANSLSTIRDSGQGDYDEEEYIFENIFFQLKEATQLVLKTSPLLHSKFSECLEASRIRGHSERFWERISKYSDNLLNSAQKMNIHLATVKLEVPRGSRYQPDFWNIYRQFTNDWCTLIVDIKNAKDGGYVIPRDVSLLLKPIRDPMRAVTHAIQNSPWSSLVGNSAPPQLKKSQNGHYSHVNHSLSNAQKTPPTPLPLLDVALGPAAQATVPSASVSTLSGYTERFFAGDVYQRADAVLAMRHPVAQRR